MELLGLGNKIFSQVIIAGFIGRKILNEKVNGEELYQMALDSAYLAT